MMQIALIVFLPFLCGPAAYLLGRKNEKLRDIFAGLVTGFVLVLSLTLTMNRPALEIRDILVSGLSFTTNGFRITYAVVTAVMWFFTSLFSPEYFHEEKEGLSRYWMFVLVTFGATEGVMLSADLVTAFVFFEILSFTSFTWVIHEETKEAIRAGYTYLFIAVIGGLVLLMGLLLLFDAVGTLRFSELRIAVSMTEKPGELFAAGICILLGFGAKAGMFPVHIWLPKAHPVAPSPGSALLSGILTKVGIYGILMTTINAFLSDRAFGCVILSAGVITMALGAVLALFSVNLKRTLACSSMSQIGFILTGLGMHVLLSSAGCEEGSLLAWAGLMLHMVNHSLIKLTLFMAAGVVVMRLHTLTLDEIRGFGRNKPFLKAAFLFGALGISGVPLFNGFISKTLLHESIVEGIHEVAGMGSVLHVVEWIFLVSGGLTFAYMLKLFICVFVEKNADSARQEKFDAVRQCMNPLSTFAIFGSSLFMVILGRPGVMTRLAYFMTGNEEMLSFRVFTAENLKGGLISLAIGAFVYLLVVRKLLYRNGSYVNLWPERLDLENLVYRPLLTRLLPGFFGGVAAIFGENRILGPAAAKLTGAAGQIASVFGENKILAPVSRAVLFVGSVTGKILSDSTDLLLLVLRKSIFREKKVTAPREEQAGFLWRLRYATTEAVSPLLENFTFAMLMTCVGILLILGVLVLLTVFHVNIF